MDSQTVYFFSCGSYACEGLSLDPDGANLPSLHEQTAPWSFVRAVPMSERDLEHFIADPVLALANLETRGYHIARLHALPQANRHSS